MAEQEKVVQQETVETTASFTKEEMEQNKGMAILSYILPFIPYFVEKQSKWVRFHAIQGMNLLIVSIAFNVIMGVLSAVLTWRMWWITSIITSIGNLGIFILVILGIVNVCNNKANELPIISKIKILKK